MNGVTINKEQKLFVIPCGKGFTTLGFDYARKETKAIADWLGRADLQPGRGSRGTLADYVRYENACEAGEAHFKATGERCFAHLHPALIGLEGQRVECVLYGDVVRFQVGRSTGWFPVHLQIHNARSLGGSAISHDAKIGLVRVIRRK